MAIVDVCMRTFPDTYVALVPSLNAARYVRLIIVPTGAISAKPEETFVSVCIRLYVAATSDIYFNKPSDGGSSITFATALRARCRKERGVTVWGDYEFGDDRRSLLLEPVS